MTDQAQDIFTVAICTRDRAALLKEALPPILAQLRRYPRGQLLVVDNGSVDATGDYLSMLAAEEPRVRWVVEPRPGIYFARARAVAEAIGEFLLFTDDDVIVGEDWIDVLLGVLRADPRIGIVGTNIDPLWEAPRPAWFTDRMLSEAPVIRARGGYMEHSYPCYPPTASMALRIMPFMTLYLAPERQAYPIGWTEAVGRGGMMLSGEDLDLCEIYARNGMQIVTVGSTTIRHRVGPSKLTESWVVGKLESDGRLLVRLARLAGKPILDLRGLIRLAAYPLLLCLQPLRGALPKRHAVMLRAFWRRSHGYWAEWLFGRRGVRYPYRPEELGSSKVVETPR